MTVTDGGLSTDRRVPPSPVQSRERRRLTVRGVVQGVGFRPFVWRLAHEHDLAGSVRNTLDGVVIEVEGAAPAVDRFATAVVERAPTLARVASLSVEPLEVRGETEFQIKLSGEAGDAVQPPPADAVVCDQCLAELADPFDRRHRYPFINCTCCGPRFTIIEDLPYDRPRTTMRRFPMCEDCSREYRDPGNRRFHAEPVACPACGPQLTMADAQGEVIWGDPIDIAAAALRDGAIVAVKGLGGFQLACDATDAIAVDLLRERKRRPAKPFAVMAADLAAAETLAVIDADAADALAGPAGPIVLLPLLDDSPLAPGVVAGLDEVGVMLPSTPLHHLLMAEVGRPLVMTSGNVSDEPICRDNDEAVRRLGPIVDLFLLHDRDIAARYDDSVVRSGSVIRAARGLTPGTLALPEASLAGVAMGAHLKNTFALVGDGRVLLSPHLGDLETPLALENADQMLEAYLRLFRVEPRSVACDLHPDYASTARAEALAERVGGRLVRVQHHHAHVASVMLEHGVRGPLVGVALDGTGFGTDGTVWGGEVLVADEHGAERAGHIAVVRQPGGDRCAREGWRMAAAYLHATGVDEMPTWWGRPPVESALWAAVTRVAGSELAPLSSSAGRLFDAVASLLDIAHVSTFEGEAAMRLEAVARRAPEACAIPLEISERGGCAVLDTVGLVSAVVQRRAAGEAVETLAAAFHASLGAGLASLAAAIASRRGLDRVALSGGCFQNRLLLAIIEERLRHQGLEVYVNHRLPANDGGVSAGQALVLAVTQEVP